MPPTDVDAYLREGCGRCEHYRTPRCKVHPWRVGLEALREVLLAAGLQEAIKWGSPCYMLGGKNVAMLLSMRESFGLSFLKGAALQDAEGALEPPGPNSRHGRLLRFRSVEEALAGRPLAARYLAQAIALEQAGGGVIPEAPPEPMPEELAQRLAADPSLQQAFEALTPGRRRSHVLHVAGAKQPETRARRVERCGPAILAGKGFNER
ncbi:MAG: YdeI/OmpD-associated family protein [Candidatus Sericytochromatia bacterium]|nr:YdeI/OmpD-associated family protein [Candidatus Sericytochromatia bacterium]